MYRSQKNYENLQRIIFDGVGEYGIPQIQLTSYKECDFIPFNYAKTCKDKNGKGVHFFIDDYQFNRLWNAPDRYIDMLSDFTHVMSPDLVHTRTSRKLYRYTIITASTGWGHIFRYTVLM